jgi:glucosamine--fructose-6-phosphate aminotransferase (isomerizing)
MCGLFGYVGQETDVGDAVLTALKTLEYRGYDSWGLAIAGDDSLLVEKDVGRINGHRLGFPPARLGLGHTRWATHGGVTVANAHPHLDCRGRLAVVHNGIIENHGNLRAELTARGHAFTSETDSEVVAHLVEERLERGEDFDAAVSDAFGLLAGYNAIAVMDPHSGAIAAAKRVSPLVVGQSGSACSIASDPLALRQHADRLVYLEDDQIALLTPRGFEIRDRLTRQAVAPAAVAIHRGMHDADRGAYPDFFSKEVSEQPATLRRIVAEGRVEIEALAAAVRDAERVVLVGCGTAGNAALAGAYLFSEVCRRDVTVIPASEFRYRSGAVGPNTLVITLSQSGETVDVLDAVALGRERGASLAAIVNSEHSTLDRTVDRRVRLRAGVEQCVLATKSYTAKLAVLLLTAYAVEGRWDEGAHAVRLAADGVESMLADVDVVRQIEAMAGRVAESDHLFVIGRGPHYASALEAALKIKEASYLHAEGFASGELKHGVIALVTDGTPCLVFAPSDATRTDVLSSAAELRSRGARTIGVGSEPDPVFDEFIPVPDAGIASPLVEAVPGQLLGYFAALAHGNDPDRPRNLAKSVTVK